MKKIVMYMLKIPAKTDSNDFSLKDPSLSRRIHAADDSIAQLLGDWNEIKGWAGATHGNARDGHGG